MYGTYLVLSKQLLTLSSRPNFMGEEAEAQQGEVTSPEPQSQVLLTSLLSSPGGSCLSAPLLSGAQRKY